MHFAELTLSQSVWKSTHIAGRVPLLPPEPGKKRTVVEIFQFAGSKPEFAYLAKRGQEWVGRYKEPGIERTVAVWLQTYMKQEGLEVDSEGQMHYNTFLRLVCSRAADYRAGN